MIIALVVASLMAIATVVIHTVGLVAMISIMGKRKHQIARVTGALRIVTYTVATVMGLFLIHTIEIWAYAGLYRVLGLFADFEDALYFSTTTFTTLGYGDVIIESEWRLIASVEGFNGFLLIGWSTAFLVTVVGRLFRAEIRWIDLLDEDDDEDDDEDEDGDEGEHSYRRPHR